MFSQLLELDTTNCRAEFSPVRFYYNIGILASSSAGFIRTSQNKLGPDISESPSGNLCHFQFKEYILIVLNTIFKIVFIQYIFSFSYTIMHGIFLFLFQ